MWVGGVVVGFGYSHFSGPYCCYEPYYGGWYRPYYWDGPWLSPVLYTEPGPNKGTVKLPKLDKTAEIYINQAYAGIAGDLKNIYLDPGAYDLEVRTQGKQPLQKRIYVLSGKTLKIVF